jgi:penicillin-binding protein 2
MMHSGATPHGVPALMTLHRRLKWAALCFLLVFLILIGRLWQLQILHGDGYYQRTVSNVVHDRFLPSVRGKILDRNGMALADNRPAFNLYITPKQFSTEVKDELSRLLGLSDEEIDRVASRVEVGQKRDRKQPVLALEDQGRDRAALVEQSKAVLPGIEIRHEPYRYYPQGKMAAHLVGYMSQMTAVEADRLLAQGYASDELVGRYGLESAWENYLRGKKGVERFAVDAKNRQLDDATAATLIAGPRVVAAVPGANLVLTLDGELQKMVERAVAPYAAAAVVVVEVKTGKILSMVSRPAFDPNIMTGHLTRAEETMLNTDPRKPFTDKTIQVAYPPGSIFKFVTTLAALEDGRAAEDESVICNGSYEISGTVQHCNGVHGRLNLIGAIQHSCNIYFWHLVEQIGLDRLAEVARDYGFGSPTNLGINGDSAGRIPTKAWYEQRGKYMIGFATNAATGQGDVEVTVMQMVMAYAALANGGTLFVPQVVDRVVANDGTTIVAYQPKISHQIKTPVDALDIWRRGMWKVMNEKGGTGFDHVGVSDVTTIAGKTGTAEVRKKKRGSEPVVDVDGWHPAISHAWFAGYAPAEDPQIAIVVLVEHGGGGGKVAAPIAKQIFESYLGRNAKKAAPDEAQTQAAATPNAPVKSTVTHKPVVPDSNAGDQ